jgi:MFS superfamily sulfate permease-like transporter
MNKLSAIPSDGLQGLKENWSKDALSGFLVFLIAMPLSLGIAKASGFPPITGLITAIIGGIVVSLFMGARLTIKGPAAGLIVIVAESVHELTYPVALAAIVVAALFQILFGVFKLGKLSDFFPASAVHGMLAAIGIIIMSKQLHIALGTDPALTKGKAPLQLIAMLPQGIANMNSIIAIIGFTSLLILFGLPLIKNKYIKKIPAPLLVLLVSIPMAWMLDYKNIPNALVKIESITNPATYTFASFSGIFTGVFFKSVMMFALVGSIESLLTAKAIDMKDPWKRKTNYNKDLIAVGIGNSISGMIGGLPMISEVARSSANITNGARTRWANFFHGLFLLLFVLIAQPLIEMIPIAALAAMLIAVGYRLASPKEFIHTYKIGPEQLIIFIGTIITTLATDLLIGIATGIVLKFIIHVYNGVPISTLFTTNLKIETTDKDTTLVTISNAAIFSNYIGLKKELNKLPAKEKIILDLSNTILVDHTVFESLHHFAEDYNQDGGEFKIIGLEKHKALSDHPMATRKKV